MTADKKYLAQLDELAIAKRRLDEADWFLRHCQLELEGAIRRHDKAMDRYDAARAQIERSEGK